MTSQSLNAAIRAIPMPHQLAGRPVDRRGWPVPFFVTWVDADGRPVPEGQGEPDHRCIDPAKMARATRWELCWVCGQRLGKYRCLVAGPMCLVTRRSPEPDCHTACAEYAARACPFLSRPRARRNDVELPADSKCDPMMAQRNPGVSALFVHTERWLKREPRKGLVPLFVIPASEPQRLTFWREGRRATRGEVMQSLDSGLEILQEAARPEGKRALDELAHLYRRTVHLVERWTDDFDYGVVTHGNPSEGGATGTEPRAGERCPYHPD
jgi:hypothetical protein